MSASPPLISEEEGDDSRDGLIEDNPTKSRGKFLIEELNTKDIDSSDVDITAMLDEIEEDMDLDELVRQKALLQEKLKKDGIDGISDDELDEKEEGGEREEDDKQVENNGNGAIDLENESNVPLVEIKSDSEDSDVEHLVTLDKKRDKKERRDKDSDKRRERKDPKDLLKDRWNRIKTTGCPKISKSKFATEPLSNYFKCKEVSKCRYFLNLSCRCRHHPL